MFHSVLAIPMPTLGRPPLLNFEGNWSDGSLARIDSSGAPAEPVLDLVTDELPLLLRSTLSRQSVDLWNSPIKISSSFEVVGLEYVLPEMQSGAEILLIHFAGTFNRTNMDLVSSYTRLKRVSTKTMLESLLAESATSLFMGRGVAISVTQSQGQEQVVAGDMTLEISTNLDTSKFAHGRMTHTLVVCATQYFGLCFLNLMWPTALHDKKALDEFQEHFRKFRHIYEWPEITTEQHSRAMYRDLRAMLGIESTIENYAQELRDNYLALDAQNFRKLSRWGLIFAGLALLPSWLSLAVTRNGLFALVGLAVGIVLVMTGNKFRK